MKKLFFLLVLAGYTNAIHSQIIIALLFGEKLNSGKLEFGLVVGPTFTNLTNTGGEYRSGLNLGMFFNVRPDKRFFLHAELTPKASIGAEKINPYSLGNDSIDKFFNEGSVERIIKTMGVTLLGRYTISKKFFADAGFQPDILFKERDIFTSDYKDNELQYTKKLEDKFTRLNFQLAAGLFYKFKADKGSMGLGIRYLRGLVDIDKVELGTQVNNSIQINLTVPIGAVPKEKNSK